MRAHRGQTFVIYLAGEVVAAAAFTHLIQDLTLLSGIGVKLVVVHGTQPQISSRLQAAGIEATFKGHLRVTDMLALAHAKDAAAAVRCSIEAQFAQAARVRAAENSPLRMVSGNYVMARPAGIIDGVDLQFTGEIRRIDTQAIAAQLQVVDVVLISPLGHSPTGETFSLNAMDLATEVAIELKASKLLLLSLGQQIVDERGALLRQLTPGDASALQHQKSGGSQLLGNAVRACQAVGRVHLLTASDGALLLELFTRDGIGTLVSNAPFDQIRAASIEDVGGILDLIEPLEAAGVLVKRSREKLETEIDYFTVVVRDGATVASGALYPFFAEQCGEIAGLAVAPRYRRHGFGRSLLAALEARARTLGLQSVFVLTTQAIHWFQEQGYGKISLDRLPGERRALYNFQRNSQVLYKRLEEV